MAYFLARPHGWVLMSGSLEAREREIDAAVRKALPGKLRDWKLIRACDADFMPAKITHQAAGRVLSSWREAHV